jgi:hypothetical protein
LNAADEALERVPQTPADRWWRAWLDIRLTRLDLYYFNSQTEEMMQLGDEIQPRVEQYGSPEQRVSYYRFRTRSGFRKERYVLSRETVAWAETAYAAALATGIGDLMANCRYDLALANLWSGWHGDLEEGEFHFRELQKLAEATGNFPFRARCLNYQVIIHRRRGNVQQVAKLLPAALSAARECDFQVYIATLEGNMAWLRWKEDDLVSAKAHGHRALAIWEPLPTLVPLQWTALWPLADIALGEGRLKTAVRHAHSLLEPDRAHLPRTITSLLRRAIFAYTGGEQEATRTCLQEALDHARELGQL